MGLLKDVAKNRKSPERQRSPIARIADRAFRERELLLRSDGRVRFLRLTRRLQIAVACVVGAVFVWGASATIVSLVEYDWLAERNASLRDARVAHEDLLEEIAIYQRKVAEVTGKLKRNQAELVRRFADADARVGSDLFDRAAEQSGNERLAAITESRDAMRQHLHKLDEELREMTELDDVLAASLNSIQQDLVVAVAERKKVYHARANLKKQVASLRGELRQSRSSIAQLEAKIVDLNTSLAQANSRIETGAAERNALQAKQVELNEKILAAGERETELVASAEDMRAELAAAQADYERIAGERADLEVHAAALQGALNAEEERADQLETDLQRVVVRLGAETGDPEPHNPAKESLTQRVATLLDRLTEIHRARSHVIETLNAMTVGDIEDMERIIDRTGLDVDSLLAKVESDQSLGKGGPFVALAGGVANDSLAGAVQGLDSQLARLEALKVALQAVPLVAPIDAYRTASGFGKRRDPITNKWAMHSGLDMSARSKTMIYASAPGTVVSAGWNGRYGRMVEIDHGFGIRTRYGHLRKILVKRGQQVRHRDKIALLGSSGRSTGPHLHYEILYGNIAMDPMLFIQAGKHVFKE